MKFYTCPITGQQVEITVCKPSRRKANSSIQKPRYTDPSKGGNWIAKDKEKENVG